MPTQPHLPHAFERASNVDRLRVESGPAEPGSLVIAVRGEVDIASAPVLRDALDRALAPGLDNRPRQVIVDIDGVTFMDATLLNLLLHTDERASATGAAMRVRCSASRERRLFSIVGLAHLLE